MASRAHRTLGQKVVTLNPAAVVAARAAAANQAASATWTPAVGPTTDLTPPPSFWDEATTGEKVVIVGAGLGAVGIAFLALRGGRRRRRR